jgi:small subunit ribosomal protein S4
MGKNFEPKCKQCRRIGEKLMLKGDRCDTQKCAMVKRNYPPGLHGPKGRSRKQSDFGLQLAEKQKAKKQYDMMEKQFKLTFNKAEKQTGNTGENLFKLLEIRLDNVVFRLGLASSRTQARQLVSHRHFEVNGKVVNIPSYSVKVGEIIKVRERSKKFKHFKEIIEKQKKQEIPGWLNLDAGDLSAKIVQLPSMNDINTNINTQMVVEFYSR